MNRLLLCGLFIATGSYCRAAVILSINPTSQIVQAGAPASFNLNISGLGNGTALGTYDINLGFDPALLAYSSVIFGDQVDISGLGDIQTVTPSIGSVEVFELSLDPASQLNSSQVATFTLAKLTFDTITAGANSTVTISINALGDASGNSIAAAVQNGSITVRPGSTAPEPQTFRLSYLGLAWLVFALRFAQKRHL